MGGNVKRFKIGLVGCGRISKNHLQALMELKNECELTAVCDVAPEAAAEAAKFSGAKPFGDYDAMLAGAPMDVVAIATPSGLHPEMGVKAANLGKHVITEKPMAISLAGADQLIDTCERKGVKLFVVKQNRLNTTMQLLKRAIDNGRFGKIFMAQANVFWQRPQSYYDKAKWRGTWKMDGGAFMNQASHYVDSIHWLMGEAEEVMAITGTLERNIETEDTGCAIIRFKSGAIGSINVTMLTYPSNIEGSITILGQRGSVKLGGIAVNHFDRWEFADYDDDDRLVKEANYQPPNVYGFGHLGYYKNVFAALRGEEKPISSGRDGRKSLELIIAIYRSAHFKQNKILPLTADRDNPNV